TALAESTALAIVAKKAGLLTAQVEDFLAALVRYEAERLAVDVLVGFGGFPALLEALLHRVKQLLTAVDAQFINEGGWTDVRRRLSGVLHRERSVIHAQEAGAIGGAADGDKARQR